MLCFLWTILLDCVYVFVPFFGSDVTFASCLGFVLCFLLCFLFLCISFNPLLMPHQTSCGISVPRPEIGPEPLEWEQWVQNSSLDWWTPDPREHWLVRAPMKASCWTQDPPLPNCRRHPVQDTSPKHQARKNPQTQSSADRLPTGTPPHTTSHSPARQRKPLTPSHQGTGARPSQHEGYRNLWASLNHQGQKPKGRRRMALKPGERRPQTQQVRKKWKDREILHKWRNKAKDSQDPINAN